MNIKKAKLTLQKSKKQRKKTLAQRYQSFCYKLIGKYTVKENSDSYQQLQDRLIQADMHLTPGSYYSIMIITAIITTAFAALGSFLLFTTIIDSPRAPLFILALTGIVAAVSLGFFPFILKNKISQRRVHIEREIPFTLSELSILATTGLSPIRIFRSMSQRHKGTPINTEFKKIIYKIDIDGKDIITALSETAKETPAPTFREILWDLANMIHQGGELDEYLRTKADTTMQLKRDMQKEFIDKLSVYLEVYISLALIGIILLAIGVFLLDAMGQSIMGLNSETMLLLLSLILIPAMSIGIDVMVNMAYSNSG